MTSTRRPSIVTQLRGNGVRQIEHNGSMHYAVVDALKLVVDGDAAEAWAQLERRDPDHAALVDSIEIVDHRGKPEMVEMVDYPGLLRIVLAVGGRKSERLRQWIVETAAERVEEHGNPELALHRAREEYEELGYTRPWIDQRIRSVSARQDLAREWSQRGAAESEHYRALTNEFMRTAFGMDVEEFRRFKGLDGESHANLRDHMTELEQALMTLGECTAAMLHHQRNAATFAELLRDMEDAGTVVTKARAAIDAAAGVGVLMPGSVLGPADEGSRDQRVTEAGRQIGRGDARDDWTREEEQRQRETAGHMPAPVDNARQDGSTNG